jgi:pyruvate dehydrogenase (quinone)
VRRIYDYPGDGINGVFGALQRAEDKIELIRCRDEEMAAIMASAHANFTGENWTSALPLRVQAPRIL